MGADPMHKMEKMEKCYNPLDTYGSGTVWSVYLEHIVFYSATWEEYLEQPP